MIEFVWMGVVYAISVDALGCVLIILPTGEILSVRCWLLTRQPSLAYYVGSVRKGVSYEEAARELGGFPAKELVLA